ncbi:MAG TPA: alpha/beta hydrolase-fold protein [Balneolaceae bacterium]|nr:alpha/beta hydrolase-fold protein [Balneolaceae bacterium]
MKKKTKKWRSPSLGKDMELTVYGSSGTPIIGLPTRGATCHQWEEFGMTEGIEFQLENEFNQLYCVSSVDKESFLNEKSTPRQRLVRQKQYESYLVDEVVSYVHDHNKIDYVIIAGIDLGGYHAITSALKHPAAFDKAIGISGIYDIKQFMNGFYDDNVYYCNPVDFVPNLNKQTTLDNIRDVDFRLVSYQNDARREQSRRMSTVLRMKFIQHKLDIWGMDGKEEWDLWPQMLKTHII